jgi:hypothetical protein
MHFDLLDAPPIGAAVANLLDAHETSQMRSAPSTETSTANALAKSPPAETIHSEPIQATEPRSSWYQSSPVCGLPFDQRVPSAPSKAASVIVLTVADGT